MCHQEAQNQSEPDQVASFEQGPECGPWQRKRTGDYFLGNVSLSGHCLNRPNFKFPCQIIEVNLQTQSLTSASQRPRGREVAVSSSYLDPPWSEHCQAEAGGLIGRYPLCRFLFTLPSPSFLLLGAPPWLALKTQRDFTGSVGAMLRAFCRMDRVHCLLHMGVYIHMSEILSLGQRSLLSCGRWSKCGLLTTHSTENRR